MFLLRIDILAFSKLLVGLDETKSGYCNIILIRIFLTTKLAKAFLLCAAVAYWDSFGEVFLKYFLLAGCGGTRL